MPIFRGTSVAFDQAVEETRTGDLWLFRGGTVADRLIQTASNAPVNHVGLAVVLEDLPPLMWHAELGRSLHDRMLRRRWLGGAIAEWTVLADPAGPAIVRDEIGLAVDHTVDPDVPPYGLAVLEDPTGVLPAGRVAVVGSPGALDYGVEAALQEVMTALDEDGLRDLARVSTGPDALAPDEAAQYWLVSAGLEEAPEDWVVPVDGWF